VHADQGSVDYAAAVRSGLVVIEGAPALVREFPRWLMWSPMAGHVRAHMNARVVSRRSDQLRGGRGQCDPTSNRHRVPA
jgi:hypothetical protein